MRKSLLPTSLLWASITAFVFTSCVNDSYLADPKPIPDQSFTEEFDTVASAMNRGWKLKNVSDSVGGGVWQQGGGFPAWFPAYSGNTSNVGFVGADYTSTVAQAATISNWLISPVLTIQNGDKIIFYSRALQYDDGAGDSTDYSNRLQVRINTDNEGLNVGAGFDPGDFTTSLLDINPFYAASSVLAPDPTAYPSRWTRFEATVFGLNGPKQGRFAFRYFVEGGGSNGFGSGVGIDYVSYKSVKH